MVDPASLAHLDARQLRELALLGQVADKDRELHLRQTKIDQLTHEMAVLKRWKFGRSAEQLDPAQRQLFEETVAADLAAIEEELDGLRTPSAPTEARQPKRAPLPPELPRIEIRHEPDSTTCACGCRMQRIGEDVSEKLDSTPGVFTVERHVRGKWACRACERLVQAPVPAQVIDKGMPTAGLLAQVRVAKYADHLPLYRQEGIFARAGVALSRSTPAQWVGVCGVQLQPLVDALKAELLVHPVLHADETPVKMLSPGKKKTHRATLWAYATPAFESTKSVVYDFTESRAGEHARAFLGDWRSPLVCDDYAGYKARFAQGVSEAGCMAHARRKFFDLAQHGTSPVATKALEYIGRLYDVERDLTDLDAPTRQQARQARASPLADALHDWMRLTRQKVMDGSATAKALDYSLKRWAALTHYLIDGRVPIGRVEMWRGGRRVRLSVSTPFVRWCPSSVALALFPHPAHRTGRADFPHPALFQHIKPSRSHGRCSSAAGGSIPRFHRGTGRSIGGTPFPACRVFASTRSADDAPHSDRSGGRFDLPAPG